ncbi:MAG TPA: LacI family DNA-binding transcriptional regulator [Ktedonobacterales bacterium]|nr:LacI family DNA-binding transcriptional regulator [Ktedonobacterales bacterium]
MASTKPSGRKRPTSDDVARLAGVSRTTVSLIINNVPTANIPEGTRARVQAAIAQLEYQPHEAARNLRRQASRILGVSIPDSHNPHYLEVEAGIEEYADQQGYSVILSAAAFDARRALQCLDWLKQQRIDGLIISPSTGGELLHEMRVTSDKGYPITMIGLTTAGFEQTRIDYVCNEEYLAVRLVLEHLVQLGHRRIGYIYGVSDHVILGGRLQRCLELHRELGLPLIEPWIRRCGPTQDEAYRETKALLSTCPPAERPTALVVVNDLLACAVLAALREEGVEVPTTMSVASFDNTPFARFFSPPLTSLDFNAHQLGREAARLVIERLQDPQRPPTLIEVPTQLVARASTGPAPEG